MYVTVEQIRALEKMDDDDAYPDTAVSAAIADAERRIDRNCGTSFEHKAFDVSVIADGTSSVVLRDLLGRRVLFIQTVTGVTADGDAVADYTFDQTGVLTVSSGRWSAGTVIAVTGTAGVTAAAPEDVVMVATMLTRQILRDGITRLSDRTLSRASEYGTERLAQPGMRYPTGMPLADRILSEYNFVPPVVV